MPFMRAKTPKVHKKKKKEQAWCTSIITAREVEAGRFQV
jgi:hypothetical protein